MNVTCSTDVPMGTYATLSEEDLREEVMMRNVFMSLNRLKGELDEHTQAIGVFAHLGFTVPPESLGEMGIHKEDAREKWDQHRQYAHVLKATIAFLETEDGKRELRFQELESRREHLVKNGGDVAAINAEIEELEMEVEEESGGMMWYADMNEGADDDDDEDYIEVLSYRVGHMWSAIMKSMGRETAFALG